MKTFKSKKAKKCKFQGHLICMIIFQYGIKEVLKVSLARQDFYELKFIYVTYFEKITPSHLGSSIYLSMVLGLFGKRPNYSA